MLAALAAFIIVLTLTPILIRLGRRLGLVGADIHKPERPMIPKTGGLALMSGVSIAFALDASLGGPALEDIALISSALIAGAIGLVEDVRGELNPKLKPLLLILSAAPILLLGTYVPRPVLPFIGGTRLTRIYPLLVLASFPVVANAVNGMDVLNGSMAYTSITFFAAMSVIAWLRGSQDVLTFSAIMLASLLAFTIYNRYPSRVFAGNSGSLFTGAAMAAVAIIGRLEVAAIIALLPHIMNEMHVIFSMRGLKSAKSLEARPIEVSGGEITASADPEAPITLVRMLSAGVRLGENRIVGAITLLAAYSAVLAIITEILFMG